MQHDEFVGQVQHDARLPSRGRAETAIRATLETLGERLQESSAEKIASQLPPEIGLALERVAHGQRFTLPQFVERVAEREHTRPEEARRHVEVVFKTLTRALSPGAAEKLRHQLPSELAKMLVPEEHEIPLAKWLC